MKKVLFSALAVVALLMAGQKAAARLSISQDTAYGGQLIIVSRGTLVVPPMDTATVKIRWAFSPLFTTSFLQIGGKVYVNADTVADTVIVIDTLTMSSAGTDYAEVIALTSAGNDTSTYAPVSVSPIWVAPTASLGVPTATAHGAIQPYSYNCGHTTAMMYVYASPGDTSLSFPYLVDTFSLSDSGTNDYIFSGYPNNYFMSYKFVLVNAVDTAFTLKKWVETLPSGGPAFASSIDSTTTAPDSIGVMVQVVTNGLPTAVTYRCGLHGGLLTDSVVTTIPGTSGITNVWMHMGGRLPSTAYDNQVCAQNGSGGNCSSVLEITTGMMPIAFNISFDSVYASGPTTEVVVAKVSVPSGFSAQMSTVWTDSSDVSYSLPFFSPGLVTEGAGINFATFACPGLIPGHKYRVTFYGFCTNGATVNPIDSQREFTFAVPGSSIASFTAAVDTIAPGDTTSLRLTSFGAITASISSFGSVSPNDTVSTGVLYATTTYVAAIMGIDSVIHTDTVTVVVRPIPSLIIPGNSLPGMSVFPNPTVDKVTIEIADAQGISYQITDVTGQSVANFQATGSSTTESLKNLSSGYYILLVRQDGNIVSEKKIIKQ